MANTELFDDRYTVYRRDRESSGFHGNKMGGGVLIAVSKRFKSYRLCAEESDCEDLWVKIEISYSTGKTGHLLVCGVYIPPPVKQHILDHFISNSNRVLDKCGGDAIVLGDFNLSNLCWNKNSNLTLTAAATNSLLNNMLTDFMSFNNLSQYNACFNNMDRLLDLVLSTIKVSHINVCTDPLSVIDPLHPPIEFCIPLDHHKLLQANCERKFHFYKADYTNILSDLKSIDWPNEFSNCTDVDDMVTHFYRVLKAIIIKHVPMSKPRNNKKYPAWFSMALIKVINEKFKYRNKYRKYSNPRDLLAYELLRSRCTKLHSLNYKVYIHRLELSLKSNPKLLWSFIKHKRGSGSTYPAQISNESNIASSGSDICDMFASHFSSVYNTDVISIPAQSHSSTPHCLANISFSKAQVYRVLKRLNPSKGAGADGIPSIFAVRCASALALPLALIFNESLSTGIFPSAWKDALVIPLHKGGDTGSVKNYRPISLITVFAKVFESLLCPILFWHLKQVIAPEQHGFMKSRSTVTNMISFIGDLAEGIDRGHSFDVVYTDFSKAFDKVSHNMLLMKLSSVGIAGPFLSWCRSYLTNRQSVVVVGGYHSKPFTSVSGVPQGSHLGPLLFISFINDIGKCFTHSKFYMFADDLKFFRTVNSAEEALLLGEDLKRLLLWCISNGMTLNAEKCHVMRFTRKKAKIPRTYSIDGVPLNEVDHIRDLGIFLDSKLRFNLHIDHIAKKANKMLGFVLRNCREFRNPNTKILIYCALVRSCLEHGSIVWNPHYEIYKNRLESVQKRFLYHLSYNSNLAKTLPSYEDRLQHFHMKSLFHRRKLLDIMFLYKLINGYIDASYILSQIHMSVPRKLPRSAKMLRPFATTLAHSNLGHFAPLNRLLRSYNDIYKIITANETRRDLNECRNQPSFDIFSNSLLLFKKLINDSLSV